MPTETTVKNGQQRKDDYLVWSRQGRHLIKMISDKQMSVPEEVGYDKDILRYDTFFFFLSFFLSLSLSLYTCVCFLSPM